MKMMIRAVVSPPTLVVARKWKCDSVNDKKLEFDVMQVTLHSF